MAAKELPSIEDMTEVESPSNYSDDNAEWCELDDGESVVGEIRALNYDAGSYGTGMYQIAPAIGQLENYWLNNQIRARFKSAEVSEGDVVGVHNTGETRSFVDDDSGETVEYTVYKVKLP